MCLCAFTEAVVCCEFWEDVCLCLQQQGFDFTGMLVWFYRVRWVSVSATFARVALFNVLCLTIGSSWMVLQSY